MDTPERGGGRGRWRGAAAGLACAAIGAAVVGAAALADEAVPAAAQAAAGPLAAANGVPGADTLRQAARADYVLQCAGCHRVDGRGSTPHGIPDFRNSVGAFTHLPAGREYLVRVPGAAYSQLSNAELANVLNWLLRTFSPAQLPTGFQPYTESEVAAARPHRYDDVVPVRHGLARELAALGLALSDYSYGSARAP
ncbi:cytochrome c [Achromobacter ruhlandii]|nr:cytochrome c [Achromobacter ruhlandii]MCV6795907.1 cytochrome c [Achromobacter ruhlandii]MCV6802440.1 cytochrome c [Achromobacter ruhlandii]MCV6808337.1 cytochrome c [Achromobacter ruhlandii]MCV6819427.1 cytochrome c [Achromobacter ruhlandii]